LKTGNYDPHDNDCFTRSRRGCGACG